MCVWNVKIRDQKTRDFFKSLDSSVTTAIGLYFDSVAKLLSKSSCSHFCTNGVYEVEEYADGTLEIHYHMDNTNQEIRITDHLVIPNP